MRLLPVLGFHLPINRTGISTKVVHDPYPRIGARERVRRPTSGGQVFAHPQLPVSKDPTVANARSRPAGDAAA